jgi:hypothetical protein
MEVLVVLGLTSVVVLVKFILMEVFL